MFKRNLHLATAATAGLALALGACGGGGGGVASTPTAAPTPTPAAYTVNIFADPKPQTYASVGVDSHVSSAASAQPLIRYNAGGYYEMELPGGAWDRLVFPSNVIPQDPDTFNYFATSDGANLWIGVSRLNGYSYSEHGSWFNHVSNDHGYFAFGDPTLAGNVPVIGSASYDGIVEGTSDVMNSNAFDGTYNVPIAGTVALDFDFAKGTLDGAMTIKLNDYTTTSLGSFAFTDTVFSVGSTSYSGQFDTAAAGQNFFVGQFTGPNAEETIGAWALPFDYSGDGQTHQAIGAWIAKQ
jgi:hypothetical protein